MKVVIAKFVCHDEDADWLVKEVCDAATNESLSLLCTEVRKANKAELKMAKELELLSPDDEDDGE